MNLSRGGGPRLFVYRLTYPIAMIVAVANAVFIGDGIVRDTAYATYRQNAETVARTVRNLPPGDARSAPSAAEEFVRRAAGDTGARITIIATNGIVLADSHADAATTENHAGRPEIRAALSGELGVIRRYSSTVDRYLIYAAMPVLHPETEAITAVVRASLTVEELSAITRDLRVRLGVTGTLLVLVALMITVIVSELIRRPLKDLHTAAGALAGQPATACLGRTVIEVLRNSELDQFVRAVVADNSADETRVVEYGSTERHFQVWGVRIPSEVGLISRHTLILIRDVTPEYQREQIRRDFIANVSHELKTPLTMIHGAVETLGDIESTHGVERRRGKRVHPDSSRRFTVNVVLHVLTIKGSLSVFLFGMRMMSEGLQQSAGSRLPAPGSRRSWSV